MALLTHTSPPLALILTILLSISLSSQATKFTKIYAFGDSFTDVGNTNDSVWPFTFGHAHLLPYGSSLGRPTGRYSDGRLVIDFISSSLSLPSPPPYLHAKDFSSGANFAVAGSTAIDHSFFVQNNITLDLMPLSLGSQLEWFDDVMEERGCGKKRRSSEEECKREMVDALFWVGEIGANDNAYATGSQVSLERVRALAVNSVGKFLEEILERDAKYVIVQGYPLIGCLPLTLSLVPSGDGHDDLSCSASQNQVSATLNAHLKSTLDNLRRRHPTAVISFADYAAAHRTILKNSKNFGFTEPFKTCCGSGGGTYNFDLFATCATPAVNASCLNPRKYVNWDGAHLTEAMYKVLSDLFIRHGYCHPSFTSILSRKLGGFP